MLCTACGSPVTKTASHCPNCGANLLVSGIPKSDLLENSQKKSPTEIIIEKKPMPRWLKWTYFFAVLALLVVTAAIFFLSL